MALPDEQVIQVGTQVRFFVTGSFSPADAATNHTIGSPTDVVLTLSALADGAGRQSDKVTLPESRSGAYEVLGCVDFTGETPTTGEVVAYYWLPSTSSTQANGNVAGNSGADAAAPGGALGSITLAEYIDLADFIGNLRIHDGAVVQNGPVGILTPTNRSGQLLVVNESGDAFEADDVEMHQVITPLKEVTID